MADPRPLTGRFSPISSLNLTMARAIPRVQGKRFLQFDGDAPLRVGSLSAGVGATMGWQRGICSVKDNRRLSTQNDACLIWIPEHFGDRTIDAGTRGLGMGMPRYVETALSSGICQIDSGHGRLAGKQGSQPRGIP